jgi:hypothetical protein
MSTMKAAALGVSALALALITGCVPNGLTDSISSELTGSSLCRDYMKLPRDQRYDTAIRLSSELHARDAGNPLWAPNLDYNCGQSPSSTIRSAFGK